MPKQLFQFINANALNIPLVNKSVQMVATSPPYYGLRDYGVEGQLGLEPTMQKYVENMVLVFREVWRVLKDDGVLWLNLGDSYNSGKQGVSGWERGKERIKGTTRGLSPPQSRVGTKELKKKDLLGIPWRVAFALQDDGWYLRQDIIWNKPNPMPESVRDRCTKAHEYIFLLTKSPKYYYDHEAIKTPAVQDEYRKTFRGGSYVGGSTFDNSGEGGKSNVVGNYRYSHQDKPKGSFNGKYGDVAFRAIRPYRNRRSVWTVASQPYQGAHFAVWPPALVEPMIKAGSRPGDVVLDPFCGSGTTGIEARRLRRQFVGLDLSFDYLVNQAKERSGANALERFSEGIRDDQPIDFGLFAD